MTTKLRRALLRGRRADFWFRTPNALILRHPNSRDHDEIPWTHVHHPERMAEHYARLAAKNWVAKGAIDELRELADGAARGWR